jgi:hypothetical protein
VPFLALDLLARIIAMRIDPGPPLSALFTLWLSMMAAVGHIEYGDGVPYQLAALGIDDVATALPWPADAEYPIHDPPIADILFGVAPAP